LLVVAAVSVAGRPHYLHHRACIAQFCMRVAACALLSWPAWYVQAPDAAHKDIRRRARFNTPVFTKWHKSADNTPGSSSIFEQRDCADVVSVMTVTILACWMSRRQTWTTKNICAEVR
jgi:hypothetical protein